jgi:hypothetical protein
MGPARTMLLVPGPPRYATRGNLSAVAGVAAKQKGESLTVTKAYDRDAAYEP